MDNNISTAHDEPLAHNNNTVPVNPSGALVHNADAALPERPDALLPPQELAGPRDSVPGVSFSQQGGDGTKFGTHLSLLCASSRDRRVPEA